MVFAFVENIKCILKLCQWYPPSYYESKNHLHRFLKHLSGDDITELKITDIDNS